MVHAVMQRAIRLSESERPSQRASERDFMQCMHMVPISQEEEMYQRGQEVLMNDCVGCLALWHTLAHWCGVLYV